MARNPFHLVTTSPWPFTASIGAFFLTSGLTWWMHQHQPHLMFVGMFLIGLTMVQWWRDVIREATFQGHHTQRVLKGLRWGMILFILSEVCFFFAFFWAYFHSSLAPSPEIGIFWPPMGIHTLAYMQIPLLNTGVLLASGATVTWAHYALLVGDRSDAATLLFVTVCLGVYFTVLQVSEYYEAPFTISDSVYGTTFFVATGFHGLHVMMGTVFLSVGLVRVIMFQFSKVRHFGFEAAAWYWHFVDVVWLFLYLAIYWWGSIS